MGTQRRRRQTQPTSWSARPISCGTWGRSQWASDFCSNALKIARKWRQFPTSLRLSEIADLIGPPEAPGRPRVATQGGLRGRPALRRRDSPYRVPRCNSSPNGRYRVPPRELDEGAGQLGVGEGPFAVWLRFLAPRPSPFRLGLVEKSGSSLSHSLRLARDVGYDRMLVREARPAGFAGGFLFILLSFARRFAHFSRRHAPGRQRTAGRPLMPDVPSQFGSIALGRLV